MPIVKSQALDTTFLPLLFTRMVWPNIIIRRRAATLIYELLIDQKYSQLISSELLRQIEHSQFESLASNYLLFPLRLKAENRRYKSLTKKIMASLKLESPLSEMLLNMIRDDSDFIRWEKYHSGNPPMDYKPEKYFLKNNRSYLPLVYYHDLKDIEDNTNIPILKQWAYECDFIFERTGIAKYTIPRAFLGYTEASKHEVFDIPQSEAFRSAYMRALAWAVDVHGLPEPLVLHMLNNCIPLDVNLWRVKDIKKPTWWPKLKPTNTAAYREAAIKLLSKHTLNNTEQVIGHLSGHLLAEEDHIVDLNINGALLKSDNKDLNLDALSTVISEVSNKIDYKTTSPYGFVSEKFESQFINSQLSDYICSLNNGISIAPVSVRIRDFQFGCRWEIPRAYRGIKIPTPSIVPPGSIVQFTSNSIKISNKGQELAQWVSWNDKLAEAWYWRQSIPPPVSSALILDRQRVKEVCQTLDCTYVFIIELRIYSRADFNEEFDCVHQYAILPLQ